MKNTELMNKLTRSFYKVGFQIKKHSPEILLGVGVVGVVTSGVMACKASTKVNAIIDEAKTTVNGIHRIAENPERMQQEEYTEEDIKKALAVTYTRTGVELVKLYGPAIALGAASITCILASHNIVHKRNVALAAAYTAVDTSFKEYRGRLIERFGKELDRELKYNIKAEEIEETVTNEDGTETTVTKTVEVANLSPIGSMYAKFFDEYSSCWQKSSEYNYMFLIQQQNYANEKLQKKGYLFLNEVYEMLGLQKTQAGQAVGWVYDKNHPKGDNIVDFGIYDLYDESKRRFVNGFERSVLIDPNVDGDIRYIFEQ
jgi:hypothetical protein